MFVSERLVELREKKGLTRMQLAKKAGVSSTAIYKYETSQLGNLTVATIEKLSAALSVSALDLLGWQTEPAPSSDNVYRIPLYSRYPGDVPFPLTDDIVGYANFDTEGKINISDVYALKLCDEALFPSIEDGDIAIIKKQDGQDTIDGDLLYAVIIDGNDVVLRKIKVSLEGIYFIPLCPDCPPSFFSWEQANKEEKIKIVGMCLEIQRKYPKALNNKN